MLYSLIALLVFISSFTNLHSEAEKYVSFKANPDMATVKSGGEFKILLNMEIASHWYTYSLEQQIGPEGIGPSTTEILLEPKESLEMAKGFRAPKTKKKFDEGFGFDVEYYEGSVDFILPVKAKKDLDFGADSAWVIIWVQMCDTTKCLPPEEVRVLISSETVEIAKQTEIKPAYKTESQQEIDQKKSEGAWSFLWFAMGAGALALLTPCVFPMVPITVSFFVKRAETHKGKGLRDSLIYAIGIIITFTALGFLLAMLFGATGIRDFAANGWVNLFIAAIFIIFALNLFGAFEIQLPTGMMNKLHMKSSGSGIVSVLLMGLTFSLTSFTCTVPFVGSALISASGGEWFYPIIGMLGFSAVFAAPFFLLALFPSAMTKMPKAGGWMNSVKVVMAFLEIAAAIKFISNADLVWAWGIMPRELFISIWIACGFLIVFYILGFFRLTHDTKLEKVGATRMIFAILFGAISFNLIAGLFGKPLGELDAFLPPPDYDQIIGSTSVSPGLSALMVATSKPANENWVTDFQLGLEMARKQNKNVFVDFTGFTCTNCRQMETKMFPRPQVSALMNQYVKVKLFTDRREEPYLSNKKLQQDKFGSIELPLYVIITPSEELIATNTFTRDVDGFVNFLKKGLK